MKKPILLLSNIYRSRRPMLHIFFKVTCASVWILFWQMLDTIAGTNGIYSCLGYKCSNSNNSRGREGSCYYFGTRDYLTIYVLRFGRNYYCDNSLGQYMSRWHWIGESFLHMFLLILFQVAVLYFHDQFTWMKGLGLLTIMAGVSLFNWYK